MTVFEQLLSDLKSKKFAPIYFLMGTEPYYIDMVSNYIEHNALDESERDFNQTILYGNEVYVPTIIENAKRFPMMAEKQVVIIKEAQHLSRSIEKLEAYLQNIVESTILVVCYKYKALDKRKKFTQKLNKLGYLYTSDKVKDWHLPQWIGKYIAQKGYKISDKNTLLLSEHLGNDLSKITKELEKAVIALPKGSEITTAVIESNIGISKEFNNFELTNALSRKDLKQAHTIAYHFGKNPKLYPFVLTVSMIYGFFSKVLCYHYTKDKSDSNLAKALKIHPFVVKEYKLAASNYSARKALNNISILREYDMKSKGFGNANTPDSELLKELVFQLMH